MIRFTTQPFIDNYKVFPDTLAWLRQTIGPELPFIPYTQIAFSELSTKYPWCIGFSIGLYKDSLTNFYQISLDRASRIESERQYFHYCFFHEKHAALFKLWNWK